MMRYDYNEFRGHSKSSRTRTGGRWNGAVWEKDILTAEDIHEIMRDEELRLFESKRARIISKALLRDLAHSRFQDELKELAKMARLRSIQIGDPFRKNLPPFGYLAQNQNGSGVHLMDLPTGEAFHIPKEAFPMHIQVTGPSGSGKSTVVRHLVEQVVASGGTVVECNLKGEVQGFAGLPYSIWNEANLKLDIFKPVGDSNIHAVELCENIAFNFNLIASKRELLSGLAELYDREGPFSFDGWIQKIRGKQKFPSQMQSTAMGVLQHIAFSSYGVFKEGKVGLIEEILSTPGYHIINACRFPDDVANFIHSLFISHEARMRRENPARREKLIVFVIDDALDVVRGSSRTEAEYGLNPLSKWATVVRAWNMGLIIASQNISIVAPTLVQNSDTLIALGSHSEDANTLATYMGLDDEQKSALPEIRRGELICLCRSVWPAKALRGQLKLAD